MHGIFFLKPTKINNNNNKPKRPSQVTTQSSTSQLIYWRPPTSKMSIETKKRKQMWINTTCHAHVRNTLGRSVLNRGCKTPPTFRASRKRKTNTPFFMTPVNEPRLLPPHRPAACDPRVTSVWPRVTLCDPVWGALLLADLLGARCPHSFGLTTE